jgi:uncharacterized protein
MMRDGTAQPFFSANEPATPCLVVGKVMHARQRPARHHFVYPVLYCVLPLHELQACDRPGFGINRAAPMSFHERDHGARDGSPLMPWLRALVAARLGEARAAAIATVWVQCFPRMLGYVFNPVSFWYACREDGAVVAILAEVNNTFGEHHNYLLAHPDGRPITDEDVFERDKVFHVSPFFPVRGHYRFRFALAGGRPTAHIDYADAGGDLLRTAIAGSARPLTGRAVALAMLGQPLFTFGVMARIHWQAAKLYFGKRVAFFRKPLPPIEETSS